MIVRQPASDSASPVQNEPRGRRRKTSHDITPTKIGVLLPRIEATAAPVCITDVFHSAMSSAKKTPPSTANQAPRDQHRAGDEHAIEARDRARCPGPSHQNRRPRDAGNGGGKREIGRQGGLLRHPPCVDHRSCDVDPPPLRLPCVGGGGSFIRRSTGFSLSSRIPSCTARSSCGSCPAMTSFGQFSTSMSGGTPSFSTAHLPSRSKKPPRGAIIDPPSTNVGVSAVCTRPPHVRLPTSGPSLRRLNMYGIRSPPEPAISLMIITFGPHTPAAGLVNGMRSPATLLK